MRTLITSRPPRARRPLGAVLVALTLAACTAGSPVAPATAADRSLSPAPLLPGEPMTRFTRSVARTELGRELFGDPAGAALVGQVEIFDRYPFVRARYVQLVTDATWNRILFGEPGSAIRAFDGRGTTLGPLNGPQGIDRDPAGRIFVADRLNDRVVVLELRGDGADLRLEPSGAITGLSRPTAVAWDGGTTPLDPADDMLWVANTGRDAIVGYSLAAERPMPVATYGEKGNGPGQFLAPTDLEVGRVGGVHSRDLYVADWGNGRLVHLTREGTRLTWAGSRMVGADVRSVATDAWGNVYAALRDAGQIVKLDRELEMVFASERDFPGVRDLGVGFLTVTDHRNGTRAFTGYGSLQVLEHWSETSGASRLAIGVEARDLAAKPEGNGARLDYLLTDHADVEVKVVAANGRVVRTETLGRKGAGRQEWSWDGRDAAGVPVPDGARFEIVARSLYADGGVAYATVGLNGAGAPPASLAIVGVAPNPANPRTQIQFFVPAAGEDVVLDIVDANGRIRRRLATGVSTPGSHVVEWDGNDHRGVRVGSGVYFVSLRAGLRTATSHKLTVVR